MKIKLLQLLVFLIAFGSCTTSDSAIETSVMTYNIRYGLAVDGENSWEHRKQHLVALIQQMQPVFLGTQEGLPFQIDYLKKFLPDYKIIGTDRDGTGKGEGTFIFYDATKFKVIENQTYWLAIDQHIPEKLLDAAFPRIYTYGLFEHIPSKKKIWIVNTHFDHVGTLARAYSAQIILDKIAEINTGNYPLVFMGDLNSTPESSVVALLKTTLTDTKDVSIEKEAGVEVTFNDFIFDNPAAKCIDYLFVIKNSNVLIKKHQTIDVSTDSRYPSDHFPVYIELYF